MRIYVACLAAYNAGRLHGEWIDCDGKSGDEIQSEVDSMLARSPEPGAEEWAIHDYEAEGVKLSEGESFDTVADISAALAGDYADGFRFLLWNGYEAHEAAQKAEEVIFADGSPGQAVEQYYEGCGMIDELPEWARFHIDWESIARDWVAGGDVVQWEGRCVMNGNSL